jgi:hypothetical protein
VEDDKEDCDNDEDNDDDNVVSNALSGVCILCLFTSNASNVSFFGSNVEINTEFESLDDG